MTIKKAIISLNDLKSKIPVSEITETLWLTQATSLISLYFGVDSPEYKYIINFRFNDSIERYHTVKYISGNDELKNIIDYKTIASIFIDNCIITIKNNGLTKQDKKSYLNKYTDKEIIASFFASLAFVGGICFTVGKMIGHNKIEKLEFQNSLLKDSISNIIRIVPANSKPNDITQKDTIYTKKKY